MNPSLHNNSILKPVYQYHPIFIPADYLSSPPHVSCSSNNFGNSISALLWQEKGHGGTSSPPAMDTFIPASAWCKPTQSKQSSFVYLKLAQLYFHYTPARIAFCTINGCIYILKILGNGETMKNPQITLLTDINVGSDWWVKRLSTCCEISYKFLCASGSARWWEEAWLMGQSECSFLLLSCNLCVEKNLQGLVYTSSLAVLQNKCHCALYLFHCSFTPFKFFWYAEYAAIPPEKADDDNNIRTV